MSTDTIGVAIHNGGQTGSAAGRNTLPLARGRRSGLTATNTPERRKAMQLRFINAMLAIVASLLPFPALRLLDHLNRGCGDGLCGFLSGLLILGGLAIATVVFAIRSAQREDAPPLLRVAPLALWAIALATLVL